MRKRFEFWPQSNQRGIETGPLMFPVVLLQTPQSNQRGIETIPYTLPWWRAFLPQSNQRGIETARWPIVDRIWAQRLNRTSVGLKQQDQQQHRRHPEEASIEPAWD